MLFKRKKKQKSKADIACGVIEFILELAEAVLEGLLDA